MRDTRALKTIPVWNKIAGLSIPKAKRRLMAAAAGSAKACDGSTVIRRKIRAAALKATTGDNQGRPRDSIWSVARNLEG